MVTSEAEALAASKQLGYPVMVRPSYVLGGRAMEIVYRYVLSPLPSIKTRCFEMLCDACCSVAWQHRHSAGNLSPGPHI